MRYLLWVVVAVLMLVVARISQHVDVPVENPPSLLSKSTAKDL